MSRAGLKPRRCCGNAILYYTHMTPLELEIQDCPASDSSNIYLKWDDSNKAYSQIGISPENLEKEITYQDLMILQQDLNKLPPPRFSNFNCPMIAALVLIIISVIVLLFLFIINCTSRLKTWPRKFKRDLGMGIAFILVGGFTTMVIYAKIILLIDEQYDEKRQSIFAQIFRTYQEGIFKGRNLLIRMSSTGGYIRIKFKPAPLAAQALVEEAQVEEKKEGKNAAMVRTKETQNLSLPVTDSPNAGSHQYEVKHSSPENPGLTPPTGGSVILKEDTIFSLPSTEVVTLASPNLP